MSNATPDKEPLPVAAPAPSDEQRTLERLVHHGELIDALSFPDGIVFADIVEILPPAR